MITRPPWFEPLILMVILLNTLTLMLSYDGQGVIWRKALNTPSHIFSAIYVVEAALKILALGRTYFKDGWNIFDFFIVVFTLIDVVLAAFASTLPISPSVLRVLRVLRVMRVLSPHQTGARYSATAADPVPVGPGPSERG